MKNLSAKATQMLVYSNVIATLSSKRSELDNRAAEYQQNNDHEKQLTYTTLAMGVQFAIAEVAKLRGKESRK